MNLTGKKIDKGWGHEIVFADMEDYCGKLLAFNKKGQMFSMHFHDKKDETWYVYKGSFQLRYILTKNAEMREVILNAGDVWHNERLSPHQLIALEDDSIIFEVSTHDDPEDSFRVTPGDSQ